MVPVIGEWYLRLQVITDLKRKLLTIKDVVFVIQTGEWLGVIIGITQFMKKRHKIIYLIFKQLKVKTPQARNLKLNQWVQIFSRSDVWKMKLMLNANDIYWNTFTVSHIWWEFKAFAAAAMVGTRSVLTIVCAEATQVTTTFIFI